MNEKFKYPHAYYKIRKYAITREDIYYHTTILQSKSTLWFDLKYVMAHNLNF